MTSAGTLTIPRTLASGIQLGGRQSKVVLADYPFGAPAHANSLLYSTAALLFAGTIGGADTVLLYGDADQGHEFAFASRGGSNATTAAFAPGFVPGLQIVASPKSASDPLVLFADTQTASMFFAPALPTGAKAFASYWQVGTNDTVLVGGPALVRNASLSGARLSIRGDLNASTPLTLVVPTAVESVEWNGAGVDVKATHEFASVKILQGQLSFELDKGSIAVPTLEGWKFQDSLPEVQSTFDDTNWTVADNTSTNITTKPVFGDGRVLYGASPCFGVGCVED